MSLIRAVVRALVPGSLRKAMVDAAEGVARRAPGEAAGLPQYDLAVTQVYPKGNNLYGVLRTATQEKLAALQLDSSTPVASIGTCFAEEFAFFMTNEGHNYLRTEHEDVAASANWGRVYTIPNLLQIVRYSVDPAYPMVVEYGEHGWFDPLREARKSTYAATREEAEGAIRAHRRASYRAFAECRILIITVGQNEAWVDKSGGHVWAKLPPREVLDARRESFRVTEFGFAENVAALEEVVMLLHSVNPTLKIVFTVSPVASQATFSDTDVVSRSFANKCLLRAVVNDVVEKQPTRLFYFPSFEMVLCDNPRNFRADNRHVKYSAVARVFSLLSGATALGQPTTSHPHRGHAVRSPAAASLPNKH